MLLDDPEFTFTLNLATCGHHKLGLLDEKIQHKTMVTQLGEDLNESIGEFTSHQTLWICFNDN